MGAIKIYQADAFTDRLFSGNPAAVCILDSWLSDDLMQSIANENNLAETAFVVSKGEYYEIRWFTPTVEVDLCGHATLASAFTLFNVLNYPGAKIRFHSLRSGLLTVEKIGNMLFLDFPADELEIESEVTVAKIANCIGVEPIEIYRGKSDLLALIDSETALLNLQPRLEEISGLNARGLIVTAKGDNSDFVSRFFAPQSGINEDPVTGSAHTSLIPFWSAKLGKSKMTAYQLSKRGGRLACEFKNGRCFIGGSARLYLSGEIYLD